MIKQPIIFLLIFIKMIAKQKFELFWCMIHNRSNEISCTGLLSSKEYYKQPSGVVCEESHLGEYLSEFMCAEGLGCGRRFAQDHNLRTFIFYKTASTFWLLPIYDCLISVSLLFENLQKA